ncbi:MAG TPA: hypothetical protein VFT86_03920 [Gaiellaceae bacterium]|nr:hypothetical protein [Gaiellaceae bacterium]
MRRFAIGIALAGAGALVVRAAAPRLHARAMAACERMFEEMPESFPPKRMLHGIEVIEANSVRTLELLEKHELLGTGSSNARRSPQSVGAS